MDSAMNEEPARATVVTALRSIVAQRAVARLLRMTKY